MEREWHVLGSLHGPLVQGHDVSRVATVERGGGVVLEDETGGQVCSSVRIGASAGKVAHLEEDIDDLVGGDVGERVYAIRDALRMCR